IAGPPGGTHVPAPAHGGSTHAADRPRGRPGAITGLQLGHIPFWWVPKLWARELAVAGQHERVDLISLAQDADTASEAAHPSWVGHRYGHPCRNDTVRDQLMVSSGRLDDYVDACVARARQAAHPG